MKAIFAFVDDDVDRTGLICKPRIPRSSLSCYQNIHSREGSEDQARADESSPSTGAAEHISDHFRSAVIMLHHVVFLHQEEALIRLESLPALIARKLGNRTR